MMPSSLGATERAAQTHFYTYFLIRNDQRNLIKNCSTVFKAAKYSKARN